MTDMNEVLECESGRFPKGTLKGVVILVLGALLSYWLYSSLPYQESANKGLALLLFIAILWFTEALHITVTALMIPVVALAIGMPGLTTTKAFESFADPVIFLFFGGFALATALHAQKLDSKIAMWLISMSGSNLAATTFSMFGVTLLLSMWISNTATATIMLPLAMGILSHLDKEKDRNTFVFILLGIAYSASVGGVSTLVASPPNAIVARELGMDFMDWLKVGIPMVLVLIPLMLLSMYIVLRPNLNRKIEVTVKEIPWTPLRVIVMLIFACTALAWVFSTRIASYIGISSADSWIAVMAAIAVVASGAANWKQLSDNTQWGVLLLFGGGLTLSMLLQSSGASAALGQQVSQTFGGAHPFFVILAVAIFINVLTEFTSNTASASMMVPMFAAVAPEMGMEPDALVLIIGIGAACSFMLPVATPPNALVFGTGLIKQREMISVGLVLNVLCITVISLWAYFVWL